MSSPIPIPIRSPSRSDASPASPGGFYVPVHRRTPGSYTPTSSPSSSSRPLTPSPPMQITPIPTLTVGVYTPAELLLLSTSPLAKLSADNVDTLRVHVPEVLQTRKQRKALAWHAHHHPTITATASRTHERTLPLRGSHTHASSESEEDRATTWRRI